MFDHGLLVRVEKFRRHLNTYRHTSCTQPNLTHTRDIGFHSPSYSVCCVSTLCTTVSLMSFRISHLFMSVFFIPIFQCPLISIFHALITTSPSVFLSTHPDHLSLASLIVSLTFATPAFAFISSTLLFPMLFYSRHPQHYHLCSSYQIMFTLPQCPCLRQNWSDDGLRLFACVHFEQ